MLLRRGSAMAGNMPEFVTYGTRGRGWYLVVRKVDAKRMEGSRLREGRGVVEDLSPELEKRQRSRSSLLP